MKLTSKKLKQIIKEEMKKLQEMGHWEEEDMSLPPKLPANAPLPNEDDYREMAHDALSPHDLEHLSDEELEAKMQQLADEMSRRGNPSRTTWP